MCCTLSDGKLDISYFAWVLFLSSYFCYGNIVLCLLACLLVCLFVCLLDFLSDWFYVFFLFGGRFCFFDRLLVFYMDYVCKYLRYSFLVVFLFSFSFVGLHRWYFIRSLRLVFVKTIRSLRHASCSLSCFCWCTTTCFCCSLCRFPRFSRLVFVVLMTPPPPTPVVFYSLSCMCSK